MGEFLPYRKCTLEEGKWKVSAKLSLTLALSRWERELTPFPQWGRVGDEGNYYAFGSQRNNFAAIKVAPMP